MGILEMGEGIEGKGEWAGNRAERARHADYQTGVTLFEQLTNLDLRVLTLSVQRVGFIDVLPCLTIGMQVFFLSEEEG